MKRSNVNVGTRTEILAELEQYGSDRVAHGKTDRAREYARALASIEAGSDVVRVRHSVWVVCDEKSPSDGEIGIAAASADAGSAG